MKPGKHLLIQVPRESSEDALLRVGAGAQREGGQCADMYFQELNIRRAGGCEADRRLPLPRPRRRLQAPSAGALRERAAEGLPLKVSRGRTQQGVKHLGVCVKDLSRTGRAAGALLGDDDHAEASAPLAGRARRMALLRMDSPVAL
ncbi:unnamed protein product [Prorocentrum cordatum]|uniref:Uncharacterized protein n=1 Tax=Prorocentrum cordatum TaxID=2364126 RepID=A0ABN9VPH0_9DINO|nr:unnamed protein product [Polarella glacialis]